MAAFIRKYGIGLHWTDKKSLDIIGKLTGISIMELPRFGANVPFESGIILYNSIDTEIDILGTKPVVLNFRISV